MNLWLCKEPGAIGFTCRNKKYLEVLIKCKKKKKDLLAKGGGRESTRLYFIRLLFMYTSLALSWTNFATRAKAARAREV